MLVMMVVKIVLTAAVAVLAPISAYLAVVTLAAAGLRKPRHERATETSFAVVIPAYDEAGQIAAAVGRILESDYPAGLIGVFVIADNCSDATAGVAREAGATAFERVAPDLRGKGHALDWFFRTHREIIETHDAVVVVDADTALDRNFLGALASALLRPGVAAVMGVSRVANPEANWRTALTYAGFALINCVRQAGRCRLGGSADLKGNGMAFCSNILLQYGWPAHSKVEDAEFGARLIMDGFRIGFAPNAYADSDMPMARKAADAQRRRWELGRMALAWRMAPKLIAQAWRSRSWTCLEAALDLMVPPLSLLALMEGMLIGLSAWAGNPWFAMSAACVAATAFHVMAGLFFCRAPKCVWVALAAAPLFLMWKLVLYAGAAFGARERGWVRTLRPGEDNR